jgi:hypothetical protein
LAARGEHDEALTLGEACTDAPLASRVHGMGVPADLIVIKSSLAPCHLSKNYSSKNPTTDGSLCAAGRTVISPHAACKITTTAPEGQASKIPHVVSHQRLREPGVWRP